MKKETSTILTIKTGNCSSRSGKSKLTYLIGADAASQIHFRIHANTGNGFFNVTQTNGDVAYTRSGAFKLDKDGFLVTNSGAQLNGFQVDPDTGTVLRGALTISPMKGWRMHTADCQA